MKFTKMHGLGNNYVLFDLIAEDLTQIDFTQLSRKVSDVSEGIGSDGIILVCPSNQADVKMRIFNKDGSEAGTCGNGLRCVARFVYDNGYVGSPVFSIETLGGIVSVALFENGFVTVDMGYPKLTKEQVPLFGEMNGITVNELFTIESEPFYLTCLSMGNPHAVLIVDDVSVFDLERIGPMIETAPMFPKGVNVSVVQILDNHEVAYRVWERGSGMTKACGTGACASVVAAILNGKLPMDTLITVHLPGGDLEIKWGNEGTVLMQGPAEYVCWGEWLVQ